MPFGYIYELLLCVILVKYAHNGMFNFGRCLENVIDLKVELSSFYGDF